MIGDVLNCVGMDSKYAHNSDTGMEVSENKSGGARTKDEGTETRGTEASDVDGREELGVDSNPRNDAEESVVSEGDSPAAESKKSGSGGLGVDEDRKDESNGERSRSRSCKEWGTFKPSHEDEHGD